MIIREKIIDRLDSLVQAFIDYQQYDPLNGFTKMKDMKLIEDLCISLWHLSEWIWKDYDILHKDYVNIGEFRKHLYTLCKELKIMHDIANSTKHLILDRRKSEFTRMEIHEGSVTDFNNPPYIKLIMENGNCLKARNVIKRVLKFYNSYIYFDLKFYDEI